MMTGRQHRSRPPWTLQYTILFMAILFAASGCALLRQREKVVIKTETVTEYRDSTAWRDTTIYVPTRSRMHGSDPTGSFITP